MRRDADRRRTESYTKFAEAAAEASKREEALRDQLRSSNRGTRRARGLEALRRAAEDRCTDAEREARRLTDEVDALRAALGRAPKRRERPPTPSASPRRPPSPKPPPPQQPSYWSEPHCPRRRRRRAATGLRRTGRASCRGATTRRRATSASRRRSSADGSDQQQFSTSHHCRGPPLADARHR